MVRHRGVSRESDGGMDCGVSGREARPSHELIWVTRASSSAQTSIGGWLGLQAIVNHCRQDLRKFGEVMLGWVNYLWFAGEERSCSYFW